MTFDLQPRLENEHVRLQPLRVENFEPLFSVASDPMIWDQHPASDRYKREVFRTFFDNAMACGGAFLIVDSQTDALIGSTRYYDYSPRLSEITVGFTFFTRSHWGAPHNRATKQLMLDHAFEWVETVALYAGPENYRSCRAIEKIGGVEDGRVTHPDGGVSLRYIVRHDAR